MGWSRAYSIVFEERLVNWFLTKKTFPLTVDQLAEIVRCTAPPAHIKNYNEYTALRTLVRQINNPKLSGVVSAK